MSKTFFVTGTGTGVGKTFVSALLLQMISYDGFSVCPFKPVETGVDGANETDLDRLLAAAGRDCSTKHTYSFPMPASPHLAARQVGERVEPANLSVKAGAGVDYTLIEGCGGLMVPLNDSPYFVADWIKELNVPLILVSGRGLGTINHTLLSVESCKNRGLPLKGIIFSDASQPENSIIAEDNVRIIERLSGIPVVGVVPHFSVLPTVPTSCINMELFYSLL